MPTIIRCTEKDLKELLKISKQCFIDAFEKVSNPDNFKKYVKTAFQPKILRGELLDEKSAFYFIKTDAGETAGYLKMRWDRSEDFFPDEKALELQRIYFLEPFWGQGLGKTLLSFAENFGHDKGFKWIYLIVWCENHKAIKFYEREGWTLFGRKDFQFGDEIHHDFALRKEVGIRN
jgi:diamine N-acetyltransferase